MEKRWTWLALMLVALVAFAGCSDDDDPVVVVDEETAFEVMAAAGAAYINDNTDCPGVKSVDALGLVEHPDDYTVIDIRSESAYLAGHIPGAFHSSLATLVDDLLILPTGKTYLLVCYSGQSAGHAKIAMEMLGYEDVYSLLWGMCGWSTETDTSWEVNVADHLDPVETANNNDDLTVHAHPVLDEPNGTVVVDRVKEMLSNNFKGISYINAADPSAQLMGNEDDYFIINYFGESDYLGTNAASGVPGHIPGAYQFTPFSSLGIDQMLDNLPTDMPIVVYCWTGQHSSQITAYLNMLGYEAYSLKFGSNNLFHGELLAHAWTLGGAPDNTLVKGPTALPEYEALVDELSAYFNGGDPWYITANVLNAELDAAGDEAIYTIIDVRSAEVYGGGHIKGAINVSVADLPGQIADGTIPTTLPFVVTCYTGQSAGYASAYLNLMDYASRSLKFGMSSWRSDLDSSWNAAVALSPQVVADTNPENDGLVWNMYPVLADYSFEARAAEVMEDGLQGVKFSDIDENLDDYFIVNYWASADYLGFLAGGRAPGHIPGAFQFTPETSLDLDAMLANLPSKLDDDPILVYCWTGQTSAQITMYLRMLGYNAHSLKFGANTLFHDQLEWATWSDNDANFPIYDADGLME